MVTTCSQNSQSAAEHGASDAEAQAVQVALATDGPGGAQGADHSVLDDLFPGDVCLFLGEVTPRNQEDLVALLQEMPD